MNDLQLQQRAIGMLKQRGVTTREIAELTFFLQEKYVDNLTLDLCEENVLRVLSKREVQNAVFTGIALDKCAEQGLLEEPLASMMSTDYGLYGVDEILAFSIVNVYGSIGFTNYGYVDRLKPGILADIDSKGKEDGVCNTFLDDIIGAIAAAAASRIAHSKG